MTEREDFLAALEAEYHDDPVLRRLTDPTPNVVLLGGDFSWGVAFPADTPPEERQRVLDLWGDLMDEGWNG